MAVVADEYKSVVGIANLYIAQVTQDTSAGYVAGTPQKLAPVAELSAEAKVDTKTQYADNIPADVITSEGETEIKIKLTAIPSEILALISGKTFDATNGRMYDGGDAAPYFALGFEAVKSNGKKRFYWFLKGRFSPPAESFATKTDATEPKEVEITFTAIKTTYEFNHGSANKSTKRVLGDEDTASFSGTNWFSQVQVPGVASYSALALSSSVPTSGATGVSRSANITLTFNNALATGEELDVVLLDASMAVVACTKTIDTARKVVTLDPTPTLAATNQHTVVYQVRDIYGQTLEGSFRFTTGS